MHIIYLAIMSVTQTYLYKMHQTSNVLVLLGFIASHP